MSGFKLKTVKSRRIFLWFSFFFNFVTNIFALNSTEINRLLKQNPPWNMLDQKYDSDRIWF